MTDLPSPIFTWINQHPNLSGIITFLISAMESVAIIGTIVPGSVMMTGIGALAGAGIIPLYPTIIWAILGAIVGDGISYWIGRYFNNRLPHVWPFKNHPSLLHNGERFFLKYGGMSVFIGRFVGPVRALVPMVAGMLGMRPLAFTIANVASAIGWAPAYMLPGIILGAASLELPPDIAVHAIIMLLLSGLALLLFGWSLVILSRMISQQINQKLNNFWQWLDRTKPLHPITTLLRHHDPKRSHGQLVLGFYLICILLMFFGLTFIVYTQNSADLTINKFFYYLFRSVRTPSLDTLMLWISMLGKSTVLLPLTITLSGWLFWQKRPHTAKHVFVLGILAILAITSLKHLTHSIRPPGIAYINPEFSYPSGHTTLATTFFFAIALLLGNNMRIRNRYWLYWLISIPVILIGVARMYLGAHWFTDVLGGWLLGSILLMIISLSWRRVSEKYISIRGILVAALITLIISGSIAARNFATWKKYSTQIAPPQQKITLQTWWNQNGTDLPLFRINRFGLIRQILNLQWLGNIDEIKQTLLNQEWKNPPKPNFITILHRLSNIQSTQHLQLVKPIYLDKLPILVLTKQDKQKNSELIVLRLWHSNINITNSKNTLWVGTIEEVPGTYSWLKTHEQEVLPLQQLLFPKPDSFWQIKPIVKVLPKKYKPRNRNILLIKKKNF